MKQTFNIPEGCKVVTVEQIGNQLITSFEPEKYEPKVGDLVKITYDTGNEYFFEVAMVYFKGGVLNVHSEDVIIGENGAFFKSQIVFSFKTIEKLTKEQFQSEFEKHGYVYDFETHTASKKRWRAKNREPYYFVSDAFEIECIKEDGDSIDDKRHKAGNYFKNEKNAEPYRDYMLKHSLNFHRK